MRLVVPALVFLFRFTGVLHCKDRGLRRHGDVFTIPGKIPLDWTSWFDLFRRLFNNETFC